MFTQEKTMLAKKINGNILFERKIAHKISDQVYKLTGVEGIFHKLTLHISFQGNSNSMYRLILSQLTTGANAIEILKSPEPILSPSWSPDGKDIAYVSFETKDRLFLDKEFLMVKENRLLILMV